MARPRESLAHKICKSLRTNPNGCWVWTGAHTANGYGVLRDNGYDRRTHRLMYELVTGETLEPSTFILHSCDNRLCCNPDHLRKGTHIENMADMVARNRASSGENRPYAKLTWEKVRAIRAGSRSSYSLAKVYGVSPQAIQGVRSGRAWREVK